MGNTLEQMRAKHALGKIKLMKNLDRKIQEDYRSHINSLPATIVMNGLGQAIAMLDAKDDEAHKSIRSHLTNWIAKRVPELTSSSFIEDLMRNDQSVYVAAQSEAMAYLNWLKQFARAYLAERQ